MSRSAQLDGRRALITGAATGIGKAIAAALTMSGARAALSDIDGPGAIAAAKEIGGGAIGVQHDVGDVARTERVFDEVIEQLGGLDIVCANAGISNINRITELTEKNWDDVMRVNAKGVFLTNREAVKRFLASGTKGAIINTASIAGKKGGAFYVHYCASKFAVIGITQALAHEVARHGIRVNAVCPSFVHTGMQDREVVWEGQLLGMEPEEVRADYVKMTPLGRLVAVEDVADVVVFLASDSACFMTGQAINVTGGYLMH